MPNALLSGKVMQALSDNAMTVDSRLICEEMPVRVVAKVRAIPGKAEAKLESRSQ